MKSNVIFNFKIRNSALYDLGGAVNTAPLIIYMLFG